MMVQLLSSEVRQLLHNKFVLILGDSVQRSVYKDLVLLLQKDCLLTPSQLKVKGEPSFEQDELVDGGQKGSMHNRTNYREVRQYCSGHHLVRFHFLTRVYNDYVQAVLEELQSDKYTPDVVIMNSCLWDISRYEQHYIESYRDNLENLFRHLHDAVPRSCLVLWNTAMPVGSRVTGGFLPRDQQDLAHLLGCKVIEANFYSSAEAKRHGFDVLDLHFHFRREERLRQKDGVHWNQLAHRRLSQLLLAHVADAWGVELPHRDLVGKFMDGPVAGGPDQRTERQSQAGRDPLTSPPTPLLPPPQNRPLLPLPTPCLPLPQFPPPLLPPVPCHPVISPQFEFCPQDTYFPSDHHFQSDQFFLNYFHSDVPSSTQTGFDFQGDFMFGPQLPRPPFPTRYYQQRAPVVHRGFRWNPRRGPYVRQKRTAQILQETGPSPPRAKASLD